MDEDDEKNSCDSLFQQWRHGPAKYWYDMIHVPENEEEFYMQYQESNEGCDENGFLNGSQSDNMPSSQDNEQSCEQEVCKLLGTAKKDFPEDAYHLVTQLKWENDVIWDGSKTRKNKDKRTARARDRAGWGPSRIKVLLNQQQDSSVEKECEDEDKCTERRIDSKQALLPFENQDLIYGRWEDDVIWDADALSEREKVSKMRMVVYDRNDDDVVLEMPEDVPPKKITEDSIDGAPVKSKIVQPHHKKSKLILQKNGFIDKATDVRRVRNCKINEKLVKDPYNISNDQYYDFKLDELQHSLNLANPQCNVQHAKPVVELRLPFIPTHLTLEMKRNFHRPQFSRLTGRNTGLYDGHCMISCTWFAKRKAVLDAKANKEKKMGKMMPPSNHVEDEVFVMKEPLDLTGRLGELILIENSEEYPPLLSQVGMCSKFKNYYKRKCALKDKGPPPQRHPFGETTVVHGSPFLGALRPGQVIPTLENNLYRCPLYFHSNPKTDFLMVKNQMGYFVREFDAVFTAGQHCPLFTVPVPNSQKAKHFLRDFLQVFTFRRFWSCRTSPRRIPLREITLAFPDIADGTIRKWLKAFADIKKMNVDWWVEMKPDFRLPPEIELRSFVTPEQCCAHYSLLAAEQRLRDAGYYGDKCALFEFPNDDEDDNDENILEGKLEDEVKTAPWNTTTSFIQAMKGKCMLQIAGPADPTGCGEGFSYVSVPKKIQVPQHSQGQDQHHQQLKGNKRPVTGTDADLRRLSVKNAKGILRKFGLPEDEIKKLSRWEVIDLVRTVSTEKVKAGVTEKGMTKYSRINKVSQSLNQERYKEECQRVFDLQNKILASSEVLSTDEDSDDEDGQEADDIEMMGKNIESILSEDKTVSELTHEQEEQERLELQRMMLGEGKDVADTKTKEDTGINGIKKKDDILSKLVGHPGRFLKIQRTFKSVDGGERTTTELVQNATIAAAYLKIRTTKDESFIRRFVHKHDAKEREEKRQKMIALKEQKQKMSQDHLRKVERMEKRKRDEVECEYFPNKQAKINAHKEISLLKRKCGVCGNFGHVRTSIKCPKYDPENIQNMRTKKKKKKSGHQADITDGASKSGGTRFMHSSQSSESQEEVDKLVIESEEDDDEDSETDSSGSNSSSTASSSDSD